MTSILEGGDKYLVKVELARAHTELHHHLSVIRRHIVFVQVGFVPNPSKEGSFFLRVFVLIMATLMCDFSVHLFHCFEDLPLDDGHNALDKEIDDLGCYSEVDDLLLEPGGIHFECLGLHLAVCGETLGRDLENVEIRHQHFCKWNVNECSQEDRKVGDNKVDDEDLLNKGGLVRYILRQRRGARSRWMLTYNLVSRNFHVQ